MSTAYLDRRNRPLHVYAIGYLAFLYVPVLFLPLFSFNDNVYVAFPLKGFTTEWWEKMVDNEPMISSLVNSLQVGAIASIVATILGVFGAKAVTRYRIPGKKPLISVIMLPLVVPGILLGVALLIMMKQIGVELSLTTVTLGHVLICVPFSMATLIPRFEGFDKSMEEASADLGASPWWTFWLVTVPLVLPGIIASLLLCFTISFDEFIIAFMLAGSEPTLPIHIFSQLRFPARFPPVLAMGTAIMAVSFVVVFFAQWISRRGIEDQKPAGGTA